MVLVALLAYFSADDILLFHERLEAYLEGGSQAARIVWPAIYLPLLTTAFLLLWRSAAGRRRATGRSIRGGLYMLVAAVGSEVVSFGMVHVGLDEGTFAYELEVIVEEGLELAGWIFVASGLFAAVFDAVCAASAASARPQGRSDGGRGPRGTGSRAVEADRRVSHG